jgi:hypothetical protein
MTRANPRFSLAPARICDDDRGIEQQQARRAGERPLPACEKDGDYACT